MSAWCVPSTLGRLPGNRDQAALDEAWTTATVLSLDGDGRIAAADGVALPLSARGSRRDSDIYLGRCHGTHWFIRRVPRVTGESITWRESATRDYDLLAAAVALTRWHAANPRCEECGEATSEHQGGAQRCCDTCGAIIFPRTDPCVIVAITDPQDRLLLARQASWDAPRRSLIAGFVEAGESAEQAVHREAYEEAGVRLTQVSYVSSQPWPMPRSLMLGFEGQATNCEVRVDGEEIGEGRYYTRAEVRDAVSRGVLTLPDPASIARSLVERWLSRG